MALRWCRLWLIRRADNVDHYILRHRWYAICQKIALSGWWGEHHS